MRVSETESHYPSAAAEARRGILDDPAPLPLTSDEADGAPPLGGTTHPASQAATDGCIAPASSGAFDTPPGIPNGGATALADHAAPDAPDAPDVGAEEPVRVMPSLTAADAGTSGSDRMYAGGEERLQNNTLLSAPEHVLSPTWPSIDKNCSGERGNDGNKDPRYEGNLTTVTSSHAFATSTRGTEGGVTFLDVTFMVGLTPVPERNTGGSAWADFNNDGFPDLFQTNHGDPCAEPGAAFWLNSGHGTFRNIGTSLMGRPQTLPAPNQCWGDQHGAAWADFDNDGDQDLMILVGADKGLGSGAKQFYVNENGYLVDRASDFGIDYPLLRGRQPTWFDFDRDGRLDLFAAGQERPDRLEPPTLFRQTDTGFVDVRFEAGIAPRQVFCAYVTDISGDGVADLLYQDWGNPYAYPVPSPVRIFDTTTTPFTDITPFWINGDPAADSDILCADFNGDLRMDLYITWNGPAVSDVNRPHRLLLNSENGLVDATAASGINKAPHIGVSAVAGDFDNDMDVDVYIVNRRLEYSDDTEADQDLPNLMLWNNGDGTFVANTSAAGAIGLLEGNPSSVTSVDFDRDGFLDLFLDYNWARDQLYRNNGNGNHWLEIDLQGTVSNRDGVGAQVIVTAGGVSQIREQNGGSHHKWSQNDTVLHFGLGEHTEADEIVVRWPNGFEQRIGRTAADQVIEVIEPTIMAEAGRVSGLTHHVQTVQLGHAFADPVVFALVPSFNEPDPVAVRIFDVQADRFSITLAEPPDLDGVHRNSESVSFLVLEAGTWQLADGTRLQVGKIASDPGSTWKTVDMAVDFDARPLVFAQTQSANEAGYALTRLTDITADSFRVLVQEDEQSIKAGDSHAAETVGWLAFEAGSGVWDDRPYRATDAGLSSSWSDIAIGDFTVVPHVFASVASFKGPDPVVLRHGGIDTDSARLFLQEDTTADPETGHVAEGLGILALAGDGMLTAQRYDQVVAEIGSVTGLTDATQTVVLQHAFDNPVVFALLPSSRGADPVAVRLSDVQSDRFSIALAEPSNLVDSHPVAESVSFMVFEAGTWQLADGTRFEVGRFGSGPDVPWNTVRFAIDFADAPLVFSQIQTANEAGYALTRSKDISADLVNIGVQEDELGKVMGDSHAAETIGWLAFERGAGAWNGHPYYAGQLDTQVTDAWLKAPLWPGLLEAPHLLAAVTSFRGADPATLRYRAVDADDVEIRLQEDTTFDPETTHVAESVALLAIADDGLLMASHVLIA